MKKTLSDAGTAIRQNPGAALASADLVPAAEERKQLMVRVPPLVRRALRHLAATHDTSVQSLAEEAVEDLMIEYRHK